MGTAAPGTPHSTPATGRRSRRRATRSSISRARRSAWAGRSRCSAPTPRPGCSPAGEARRPPASTPSATPRKGSSTRPSAASTAPAIACSSERSTPSSTSPAACRRTGSIPARRTIEKVLRGMDVTDLAASASDPFARAIQLAEIGVETAAQLARLALCPDRYTPAALVAQGAGLALRAGECARQALSAPDLLWAALELANKAEVFALVKGVALLIGEPLAGPLPILPLIERAYALGDFPALWAVEGLGHDYAESVWRESGPPRGLLADRGVAAELPEASLLMLHAGMGLAFADRLLPGSAAAPAREIRRAVAEIVALDRANSRPGYLGPALESLGL